MQRCAGGARLRPVSSTRVLIVEDHELLAQSLEVALQAEGMQVHVVDIRGDEDIQTRVAAVHPDVALLDLDLGGRREGGEAFVPGLVAQGVRVIVVTGSSDVLRQGTCLELGAVAVLSKSQPLDDVLDAVQAAAAGRPVMRDDVRQQLLADMRRSRSEQRTRLEPFVRLTRRESEVLSLLMRGSSAEAIAKHFVVSEATVRTQIRGILTKLGVSSQLAAVAEAYRVGWEGSTPAER